MQLKLEGIAGVADKLKLNPLSKNLLLAMGEHNRFTMIPGVANLFTTVMSAHRYPSFPLLLFGSRNQFLLGAYRRCIY